MTTFIKHCTVYIRNPCSQKKLSKFPDKKCQTDDKTERGALVCVFTVQTPGMEIIGYTIHIHIKQTMDLCKGGNTDLYTICDWQLSTCTIIYVERLRSKNVHDSLST